MTTSPKIGDAIRKTMARQAEEQTTFENAVIGALDDPWWRRYIQLLQERRAFLLEELASATYNRKQELVIRGQISELAWMINLDTAARIRKESGNGSRRQAEGR